MTPVTPEGSGKILDLPEELLVHVFSFLSLRSLSRCLQVCKPWNDTIQNQRFWNNLTLKRMVFKRPTFFDSDFNENWKPLIDHFTSSKIKIKDQKFFREIMCSYFGHEGPRHHPERTPFHVACKNGDLEIVKFLLPLLESFSIGIEQFQGYGPMDFAIISGNINLIDFLCTRYDLLDFHLKLAIEYQHFEVINYLVQSRNFHLKEERFLLDASKVSTSLEILKFFFENSKEKCPKDDEQGRTPLHIVVESGHKTAVEFMISHYENVDILDHHNVSPLHLAALNGNLNIFVMLYEKSKFKFSNTDSGENILNLAIKSKNLPLVQFLVKTFISECGSLEDMPIHPLLTAASPFVASLKIFKCIYGHSLNKCPVNEHGQTPLHLAVLGTCQPLIRFLNEEYRDTSIKN